MCTRKMLYIFVLLSVREIHFCTTFGVGHWVAVLCQLMVVLYRKLDAGSQLMALLVGELVSECPHTMGPTLGTNFFVTGFTPPFRGEAHALGPQ